MKRSEQFDRVADRDRSAVDDAGSDAEVLAGLANQRAQDRAVSTEIVLRVDRHHTTLHGAQHMNEHLADPNVMADPTEREEVPSCCCAGVDDKVGPKSAHIDTRVWVASTKRVKRCGRE